MKFKIGPIWKTTQVPGIISLLWFSLSECVCGERGTTWKPYLGVYCKEVKFKLLQAENKMELDL